MLLKNKISRIIAILILSIFTNLIYAAKVNGTVKQTGTMGPVEFATVTLIRSVDEKIVLGQMTDNEGYFAFHNVPEGNYRIVVKFIGFDSFWSLPFELCNQNHPEKTFGDIFIEQSSLEGEEVNVTAQKKMLEVKADKKVFNLDDHKATSGGTCCDVIKKIPGVEVGADGTISLRGSTNVSVLVNEKRTGILGTDRSTNAVSVPVPASMIESVEIITNPSSEYDPDGMTGIINFVLKDEEISGYNGEVTVNAGNTNKFNMGSSFSYRLPNTTLFAKTNYEKAEHSGNSIHEYILENSSVTSTNIRNSKLNYYNGGIKHSFTKNNLFTIEGSLIKNNGSIDKSLNTGDETLFSNEIDAHVFGIGSYNSFNKYSALDAEYSHDVQNESQELTDHLVTTDGSIIQDRKVLTLDYRTKVNDIHVETGFKGRLNSFDKQQNDDVFVFNEDIYALYSLTSFRWNERANVKLGLRYEWVNTKIDNISGNYSKLYPSAHFTYSLNPFTQFRTSFGSRVNRPSAKQLDPTPRIDSFSITDTIGNPYLEPEFVNLIEFGVTKTINNVKFDLTSYNHFIQDPIQWVENIDELNPFYSFENSGSGILNGVEGLIKLDPFRDVELRLTGNYYVLETKEASNSQLNGITKGGHSRLIASYKTQNFGEFEINGTYKSKQESPQGYQWENGKFVLDFAYQLSILDDHLRITFKGVDLLDNDIFESNLSYDSGDGERQVYNYEKQDQRTFYLSMVYKFGSI